MYNEWHRKGPHCPVYSLKEEYWTDWLVTQFDSRWFPAWSTHWVNNQGRAASRVFLRGELLILEESWWRLQSHISALTSAILIGDVGKITNTCLSALQVYPLTFFAERDRSTWITLSFWLHQLVCKISIIDCASFLITTTRWWLCAWACLNFVTNRGRSLVTTISCWRQLCAFCPTSTQRVYLSTFICLNDSIKSTRHLCAFSEKLDTWIRH